MENKREQTNEEKINVVIMVMDVILLAYKQANEFEDTIPVELINDLEEGIRILKEGGVNLDQVIERMKAHAELIEKNDSFLSGGVSSGKDNALTVCPALGESEIEKVISEPCDLITGQVGLNKCHMGDEGFFASPNVSFNKKDENIDTFSLIQHTEKQVDEEAIIDNLLNRSRYPWVSLDESEQITKEEALEAANEKEIQRFIDESLVYLKEKEPNVDHEGNGIMSFFYKMQGTKQLEDHVHNLDLINKGRFEASHIDEVSEITEEKYNSLDLPIKPKDLIENDFTKPNFESFDYSPRNKK